jgi:hypothetical protein
MIRTLATDPNSDQRRDFLCRAAGPRGTWPADVAEGPELGRLIVPASGDDGYSRPAGIGAASYAGRRDFLALGFLRDDGGGVESVSFELAILDLTASSSSVSDELSAFGCSKRLGSGIRTEDSPVVEEGRMCTALFKEPRPEDELASGMGTPYGARGSTWPDIRGLATPPFVGADGIEYGGKGIIWDGGGCDGEPRLGINPRGSCPLGSVMTCWLGLPAGPAEPPWEWEIMGDDDGSTTCVMGRLAASSALRRFLCET